MAAERIATIGPRGHVVIPTDILEALGLAPRDRVALSAGRKGVRLRPVQSVVEATVGIAKAKRYISDEEIRVVVAEERAARAARKLGLQERTGS